MAISMMNNSTALGAMGNLNNANSKLSKTISQLSSGFRINSAADDASGLAVSEKLRGQISGLSKAASNAQDGISMLQTAEGAMGSMTSIVQRMRELAVQAGDPAYTTNDRAMLQLEVDQLKEEINRVSSTTEFNTKKLLNGDAAAMWSSSSTDLEAIVRGSAAEGNYEVTSLLNNGTNNVYKTNIMNLKEKVAYGALDGANTTGLKEVVNIKGVREGLGMAIDENGATVAATTNLITGALGKDTDATALWGHAASKAALLAALGTAVGASESPYLIKFEAAKNLTFENTGAAGTAVDISAGITMTIIDMRTGKEFTSKLDLSVDGAGAAGHGAVTVKNAVTIDFGDGRGAQEIIAADEEFIAANTAATNYATKGDYTANVFQPVAVTQMTANDIVANPNDTNYTVTMTSGLTYSFAAKNAISEDKLGTTNVKVFEIDNKGKITIGDMTLVHEKATGTIAAGGTADYKTKLTDVANSQTLLKDIARFTNSDGRNVLDNTQSLTIYAGNGKQAVVTLEGSDTIEDLENKLTSAIVDQLGMGGDLSKTSGATVNQNLVNFVSNPATANSDEAVNGTFVIQTALLGKDSSLSFVGDQGIIDAFALSNIQKAEEPSVTISVKNAHTGEVIGGDTVTDSILRGVINGADLKVNAASKESVNVSYNTATKTMVFSASATPQSMFLHIKNNSTIAAIGANEGQTLDISIGRMDTTSLEIDDVNVVDIPNAQASITKLDQALEKISASRAKVGAQMNRLDYTINNLNNARENLTASESRIRDLDIAQASSDLASRQVLMQSATAMLAQANQLPSYAAQLLR